MCPLGLVLLGWERHTLGVFICMGHMGVRWESFYWVGKDARWECSYAWVIWVPVGIHATGLGNAPRWGVFMEVPVGSASSYVLCSLGVVLGGTSWECTLG